MGVVASGTLEVTANDSQEIEVCKDDLNLAQPVLKSPDTGSVVAGDDLNGVERWQVVCLSWNRGGHRVDGEG